MGVSVHVVSPVTLFLGVILTLEFLLCEVQIASETTYAFDWDAYMEQSARFMGLPIPLNTSGSYTSGPSCNYSLLTGDTGPIVYPAVHLYVHSAMLIASGWDCVHLTTEYTPKNQSGYEARVLRPHGTMALLQQGYVVLFLVLIGAVWVSQSSYANRMRHESALLTVLLLCVSRRSRSVAVLGLFNETWAMGLAYVAIALLCRKYWVPGCIAFALAANTKMNVLLFAPGLLAAMLHEGGIPFAARHIAICAAVSVAVGAPFLMTAPMAYIGAAFNLGRKFDQQWSVNWGWLPPGVFSSPAFAVCLLVAHLGALVSVYVLVWRPMFRADTRAMGACGGKPSSIRDIGQPASNGDERNTRKTGDLGDEAFVAQASLLRHRRRDLLQQQLIPSRTDVEAAELLASPVEDPLVDDPLNEHQPVTNSLSIFGESSDAVCFALLSSNFIGIAFARSLHFQFHLWYWHSLPTLLAWVAPIPRAAPVPAGSGLRGVIASWGPVVGTGLGHVAYAVALEVAWSVHPPTPASSRAVTALHVLLLAGLFARGWLTAKDRRFRAPVTRVL